MQWNINEYIPLHTNNKGQITQDLESWLNGSTQASIRIFEKTYTRLIAIASSQRNKIADLTLTPNDIVHEAYVRLVEAIQSSKPIDSLEFYRLSSYVFRLTCVDYLRAKLANKRDARAANSEIFTYTKDDQNLLHIFMLLQEFDTCHKRQATVFELNKIIGFSLEETAQLTQLSKTTVSRDVNFARPWLAARLELQPNSLLLSW